MSLALAYRIRRAFESQDRRGRRCRCANLHAIRLGPTQYWERAAGLKTTFRGALLGSVFAFAAFSGAEADSVYKVVHTFYGPPDGANPTAFALTFDSAGNLYGTTEIGGIGDCEYGGCGTVFKVAPDGTETILHSFGTGVAGGDGLHPSSPVTVDPATGDLYGTTPASANTAGLCPTGCGTIWKLAADGAYSVLHTFSEISDGAYPAGRLIRDKAGNLFGVVTAGPLDNSGAIYRYNAATGLNVLFAFNGENGARPTSLTSDKAGNLYGMTEQGGAQGWGTVFELTAGDLVFKTLHTFTGNDDGGQPVGGLILDKAGNIYGSTVYGGDYRCGCGVAFRLAPDGTETVLHAFVGGTDGAIPNGDMLRVGKNLYGTTLMGGDPYDAGCLCGVVFKLAPDGTETVLHTFYDSGVEEYAPAGLATKSYDKLLYGTATYGPPNKEGYGVVFSVTKK